jgi:hypothetical protein
MKLEAFLVERRKNIRDDSCCNFRFVAAISTDWVNGGRAGHGCQQLLSSFSLTAMTGMVDLGGP